MAADAPLIDCHAHIWGPDMPYVRSAWTRPDYVYSAENFIADMDAQGIQYGVIAAASLFGTYNDYTIRSLRKYKRLRGTANVDPNIDLYTLEAMKADGIAGVRLMWFFVDPLPDVGEDNFRRLCFRLRDLDMHLHLNIEGERLVAAAEPLLHTGVKLVIDHFGWHDPVPRLQAESYQGMLRLLDHGNIWVKLSSGFRRPDWDLPKEYTQDLLSRVGAERLLWGSDAPFVGHEHVANYKMTVDLFRHCVPDAETRRAIGETGYRFYFGDDNG